MNVLAPITGALHSVLQFFYALTHDYTLSIVLMTLLVKLILHPLTRIQLRSMKAMQVLAPHMEALKRKYKDDPKVLNQEMMALYRAHNVNPMMGCLPMLVQMPVLWGLFRLLYTKDLFGNATVDGLPWLRLDDIPSLNRVIEGLPAHPERLLLLVVPLLVAVSTWYQQRMSVTDPQQARMFVFMPVMIGYFATLYPIGLSIYWIFSTVAYIGEYYLVVGRPHPMASAPPKSQQAQAGGGQGAGRAGGGSGQTPSGEGRSGAQQAKGRPLPQGKRGAKRA
jgi:YidC/Oxa1 family membrane protein insertase